MVITTTHEDHVFHWSRQISGADTTQGYQTLFSELPQGLKGVACEYYFDVIASKCRRDLTATIVWARLSYRNITAANYMQHADDRLPLLL